MRVPRRTRAAVLVPLLAALTALGCVGVPRAATEQAQPAPAGTRVPRPASSVPAGPAARTGDDPAGDRGENTGTDDGTGSGGDGTDTVAEFRRDMVTAQRSAERYWTTVFAAKGETFRPVRRVVAYTRDGEVDCGGEPISANNAAYCSAGDFIAYDVTWAYGAFQQVGDAFVYYLLGHEYAHAIQLRRGVRNRFTIQQELQADCLAGAYLGDTVRAGELRVEAADLREFRAGLAAVGDDPDQPWFAPGAHGTAEQRTQAFINGYENSFTPCDLP
jgi:hypothetical protein